VLLSGGGTLGAINRNRLWVSLARRIIEVGFNCLRFDYHGVGESPGQVDRFRLDEPFVEDTLAAVRSLSSLSDRKVFLMGSCFGARTALAAAPSIDNLGGLILVCPPVRDFEMGERISTRFARELGLRDYLVRAVQPRTMRRLFHAGGRRTYKKILRAKWRQMFREDGNASNGERDSWISKAFVKPLSNTVSRRVPVLLLYGTQDDLYGEFLQARKVSLRSILGPDSTIEVQTLPGTLHGFTRIEAQSQVMEVATEWLVGKLEHDDSLKADK
jgi:pimeloyl-ACP methyl ester carboxylesterase